MKTGLVLGKFLPFHKGHIALIDFAEKRCDALTVLICAAESEMIAGDTRLEWIREYYKSNRKIKPVLIEYDETVLPNTSESSRAVSKKWADFIAVNLPPFDVVFSSENYGDFLAEYLNAAHVPFNIEKNIVPVSATLIREKPFRYWNFLPDNVKPFFVKKVCIVGTESSGKSTLTERLAEHFHTAFVPEMAREIIEKTEECTAEHLRQIAELHARTIIEKTKCADKILFVDTDVNITKSYGEFLFGKRIKFDSWIERANRFDLYLYLEKDAPFVQDGTRLEEKARDLLDAQHRKTFKQNRVEFVEIKGDWEEKFQKAVKIVDELFYKY